MRIGNGRNVAALVEKYMQFQTQVADAFGISFLGCEPPALHEPARLTSVFWFAKPASLNQPLSEDTRRRVTWRLVPFLLVLYFFAFIDRTNVGIAKLGMQRELGFTDEVIGFGAGI